MPDLDGMLRATGRSEYTERVIKPGLVQHDSTQLVRDINGRWQPIEVRRGDARDLGVSEHVEEETLHRRDINGTLAIDERIVTRRSKANGQDQVVNETYAPYADGSSRLALTRRIHQTTTERADGGRSTVEEVEERNVVAPSDSIRVTRRTVTAVRRVGTDRWVTDRQVFEQDVNGRLRLVITDTGETVGPVPASY